MRKWWTIVPLLISLSCVTSDPSADDVNLSRTQNVPGWFWSEEIGADVNIRLMLPLSYDTNVSGRYPVIYLLDADWYFSGSSRIEEGGISGLLSRLVGSGTIPEVILVGVCELNKHGANMRGRDFHGGRDDFFGFLNNELIPYMDIHYRTIPNREFGNTLIGHSSGGHFALYALFQYDKTHGSPFGNFVSMSGSFEGEDYDYIYAEEAVFYERMKPELFLPLNLYLAAGGGEEDRFIVSFFNMRDILLSRNFSGFRYDSKLYPGLDHGSIILPAVEDGLRFIFSAWMGD